MRTQRLHSEERKEIILAAALKVFAEKGFREATNKDIAEAAGVASPGLIYHYFPSKADLLVASISHHAPPIRLLNRADELMERPIEEVLALITNAYLDLFEDQSGTAVIKLLIGEAVRQPELALMFSKIGPIRMMGFLEKYFQKQMDLGIMRVSDPVFTVRSFIGPLFTLGLGSVVLGATPFSTATRDEILQMHLNNFMNGLGGHNL